MRGEGRRTEDGMAMNPMALLQLKERLNLFNQDHPKMLPFLTAVKDKMQEGTILELKVTDVEGKEMVSNIRLTANDMETFRISFLPSLTFFSGADCADADCAGAGAGTAPFSADAIAMAPPSIPMVSYMTGSSG